MPSPRSPIPSRRGGGPPAGLNAGLDVRSRGTSAHQGPDVFGHARHVFGDASPSSPDWGAARPSSRRSPCRVPSRPAGQRGTRGTRGAESRALCGPDTGEGGSAAPRTRSAGTVVAALRVPLERAEDAITPVADESLSPRRFAGESRDRFGKSRRRSGGHKGFRNPGREAVAVTDRPGAISPRMARGPPAWPRLAMRGSAALPHDLTHPAIIVAPGPDGLARPSPGETRSAGVAHRPDRSGHAADRTRRAISPTRR